MNSLKNLLPLCLLLSFLSCQPESSQSKNLLTEVSPAVLGQWVNMVVEIPAGSTEKWELNKQTGIIERDSLDGQPRTISYLGYPGNYGFIPQTLLPKSEGGDGDPLDIIVIGETASQGDILRCKVVGVLKLLDSGEQDDKLIAIAEDSPLSDFDNIRELRGTFPGMLEIIETWFLNYKGQGRMESNGYDGVEYALNVLDISQKAYSN